jgi:AraC family transcriptional regulator
VLVRRPATEHAITIAPGGAHALEIGVMPPDDAGALRSDQAAMPALLELLCAGGLGARVLAELRAGDQAAALALPSLMAELTAAYLRLPDERDPCPAWMRRVEERLRSDTNQATLGELADDAGVHFTHVARVFRRRHGCTVGEYARRVRITRAARRLARANEPISRIAHESGFADQSHFGRVFRSLMGVTPGAYRRSFRDKP